MKKRGRPTLHAAAFAALEECGVYVETVTRLDKAKSIRNRLRCAAWQRYGPGKVKVTAYRDYQAATYQVAATWAESDRESVVS